MTIIHRTLRQAISLGALGSLGLVACSQGAAPQQAAPSGGGPDAEQTQRDFPPKPQFQPMELQAQYQGPFEDTVIQRWRDPVDGSVCYLYIPAQVSRERREDSPFLDYGSNNIGSISCITQQMALRSVPAGQAPQQQQQQPSE
ncbi:hypothetical protein [Aquisalinus flavus]|uniref:Lipoprotein n=1 Tax=Aquisalinus flavus TaxID=1526572 RepID=A0A8J2Y580_9PROT|nr:hypothetical protein [Aquisalinus flavus]MBD0426202.1 hypothetical protein [Aquisalinus flavus]UNE48224.1 hypothetical protein FF099_09250 [Aquisalinus flavus]GGD09773.1 hypothetical protein GCM10011342_18350 [Aquisalinus flavus]